MTVDVGKKIVEVRKKIGFATQKEFANAIDVPFRTLQTYEQGTSVIPHTFFQKLYNKFDIDISVFFSEYNVLQIGKALDENKIDKVTLEIVNEQYNKALQANKLKELRVHLLNFECGKE